jgi:hypothetical protein
MINGRQRDGGQRGEKSGRPGSQIRKFLRHGKNRSPASRKPVAPISIRPAWAAAQHGINRLHVCILPSILAGRQDRSDILTCGRPEIRALLEIRGGSPGSRQIFPFRRTAVHYSVEWELILIASFFILDIYKLTHPPWHAFCCEGLHANRELDV